MRQVMPPRKQLREISQLFVDSAASSESSHAGDHRAVQPAQLAGTPSVPQVRVQCMALLVVYWYV